VGWALTALGCGLIILLETHSTTVEWIFINLIGGVGTGMLFPAMAITVQAAANSQDQAYAANIFTFLRAFGQTIGVAIGGVIFQNRMKKKMLTYPLLVDIADEYSKNAASLVEVIKTLPEGNMKSQLKESYADALKYIWIVMTILACAAFVSSAFTKAYPLDRALESEHRFEGNTKSPERDVKDTEK
jgi:hypothetical protein